MEASTSPERPAPGAMTSEISHAAAETTQLTRTVLEAWAESGTIVAKGMEDIGASWLRYTQRSMEDGVAAARSLLAVRSLREAIEVQSDYARSSLDSLFAEGVRLSDLSVEVARNAMEPLKTRLDASATRTS